jgi:hypothetical protein
MRLGNISSDTPDHLHTAMGLELDAILNEEMEGSSCVLGFCVRSIVGIGIPLHGLHCQAQSAGNRASSPDTPKPPSYLLKAYRPER